jgi:quercetin dioxygenase-like cupin family protein
MPYVAPDEAINDLAIRLEDIRTQQGPPPWRVPLAAGAQLRSVLLCWPPGHVAGAHRHPRAIEVFYVVDGEAEFTFDGRDMRRVGAGDHLFAPVGVAHAIRAVGDRPLLFLISLAPNEADDTEELTTPSP